MRRAALLCAAALWLPAAADAQAGAQPEAIAELVDAIESGLCPVAAGMSAQDVEMFVTACLSDPKIDSTTCENRLQKLPGLDNPSGYRTPRLVRHEERMQEGLIQQGTEILKQASTTPVLPGVLGALPDVTDDLDLVVGSAVEGLLEDPFTIGAMLTPIDVETWFFRLRAGAFFIPTPDIHPRIEERLDATGRSRQKAEVQSELDYDDASLLQAELSFRWRWLGRDAQANWADIGNLQASAFAAAAAPDPETPGKLWRKLNTLQDETRDAGGRPDEALRQRQTAFAQEYACFLEGDYQHLRGVRERIVNARLQDWGHLVNNQPQLFLRYRRTKLEPAIDAESHSYAVHFATGLFNNLNSVRRKRECRSDLSSARGARPCIEAFGDVARRPWVRYSPALSAFFERGWFEPLEFTLEEVPGTPGTILTPPTPPIPAEVVTVAGSRYDRYGASFGMYVFPPRKRLRTVDSTRIDVSWDAYEFETETDRLGYDVLRLTTTRQIGDVSYTITWAERGKAKYRNVVLDDAGLVLGVGYGFGL